MHTEPTPPLARPAPSASPASDLLAGAWTRQQIFARFAPDPALQRRLAARDAAPIGQPPATPARPRDGAVLLTLGDGLWLGPSRPQPGLFLARFVDVLGDAAAPALAELRAALGPDALELVTPSANPSAARRPPLTAHRLDLTTCPEGQPHHTCPEGQTPHTTLADLSTLELAWTADGPRLRDRHAAYHPVYDSGAPPYGLAGARLFDLAVARGWEYLSFGVPITAAELTRPLPRLVHTGAVTSPARWLLAGDALHDLQRRRGADRYLAWRRLVRARALPPLLRVAVHRGLPELLLHVDSPLALRCLFDTHARAATTLVLAELPGDPATWPVRGPGGHHVAELAAIFTPAKP